MTDNALAIAVGYSTIALREIDRDQTNPGDKFIMLVTRPGADDECIQTLMTPDDIKNLAQMCHDILETKEGGE